MTVAWTLAEENGGSPRLAIETARVVLGLLTAASALVRLPAGGRARGGATRGFPLVDAPADDRHIVTFRIGRQDVLMASGSSAAYARRGRESRAQTLASHERLGQVAPTGPSAPRLRVRHRRRPGFCLLSEDKDEATV